MVIPHFYHHMINNMHYFMGIEQKIGLNLILSNFSQNVGIAPLQQEIMVISYLYHNILNNMHYIMGIEKKTRPLS